MISIEDPDKNYIHSTPLSSQNWGYERGNVHYWMIWWGGADLETYETHLGRFNSEYGVQSMMPYESIKHFVNADELEENNRIIGYHNKHQSGMYLIRRYLTNTFKEPTSFEDFCYLSMCMQAYGISIRIESTRRMIPYSMGSLYW